MGRAQRQEMRRDWDGSKIEQAQERTRKQQNEIELLQWYLKNPKRKPPREMLDEFKEILSDIEESKQFRLERQKKFEKFENLVGKRIYWQSQRTGQVENGIVIKQKPGKWEGKPRYKTDTGWTVPHELIKNIVTPRKDDTLKKLKKKQEVEIGQMIEWNSRKNADPKGKVISVGRSKAQVQTKAGIWNVPFTLITKIDGRKV